MENCKLSTLLAKMAAKIKIICQNGSKNLSFLAILAHKKPKNRYGTGIEQVLS
jgi:hypothetical protein